MDMWELPNMTVSFIFHQFSVDIMFVFFRPAPEVVEENGAYSTTKSDAFSFGVCILECLTGRRLFENDDWETTSIFTIYQDFEKIDEKILFGLSSNGNLISSFLINLVSNFWCSQRHN